MAKYVFREGKFVDRETGKPMVSEENKRRFKKMLEERKAPLIRPDLPDYLSPVTGELVSGRVARREDLKKHDCYEIDPPSKPLSERKRPKKRNFESKPDKELDQKLEAIVNTRGMR